MMVTETQGPVRVGVVGTGVMGERHAQAYSELPDCELIGVYDPDIARASEVAARCGAVAFPSIDRLFQEVDAVSIVSPTSTHASVATHAFQYGLHLLIEKPFTATLDEARQLSALAQSSVDRVILVGHVERFNPVIPELRRTLQHEHVRRVTIRRLSPFAGRCLDSDVVQDLMIHDIDLAICLFGTTWKAIDARGTIVATDQIDQAVADVVLVDDISVAMIASRVATQRVREIEVAVEGAHITADLLEPSISITRSSHPDGRATTEWQYIARSQPLRTELGHFLNCIHGREEPAVDTVTGLRTMEWATEIRDRIHRNGIGGRIGGLVDVAAG